MHERASGFSPFEDEVCDGLGVLDLGAFLPLDFPLGLEPFPFPFLLLVVSYSSVSH